MWWWPPNHKIISLPPHTSNFAVINCNVKIWYVAVYKYVTPVKRSFQPQSDWDPQVENHWSLGFRVQLIGQAGVFYVIFIQRIYCGRPGHRLITLRIRNSACLRHSSIVYLPFNMFVVPGVWRKLALKVRFLTICVGCRKTTAWQDRQFRLCNMDLSYVGCSANVPLSPVGWETLFPVTHMSLQVFIYFAWWIIEHFNI